MTNEARFEVFKGKSILGILGKTRWYWRLVAPNNEILAVGAEPFVSLINALGAIATMRAYVPEAGVKIIQ